MTDPLTKQEFIEHEIKRRKTLNNYKIILEDEQGNTEKITLGKFYDIIVKRIVEDVEPGWNSNFLKLKNRYQKSEPDASDTKYK